MNNSVGQMTAKDFHLQRSKYTFITDQGMRLYHKANCKNLEQIPYENAQGYFKNPEHFGFLPCPKCCPEYAARFIENPVYKHMASKKYCKLSKADIMKAQLQDLCELFGLYIEFSGSMAYITTIAGEWFFDIFSSPIRLHHKNENIELRQGYNPKGYYHIQDIEISSPLLAVAYIYRHEQAAIKRIMSSDAGDS